MLDCIHALLSREFLVCEVILNPAMACWTLHLTHQMVCYAEHSEKLSLRKCLEKERQFKKNTWQVIGGTICLLPSNMGYYIRSTKQSLAVVNREYRVNIFSIGKSLALLSVNKYSPVVITDNITVLTLTSSVAGIVFLFFLKLSVGSHLKMYNFLYYQKWL